MGRVTTIARSVMTVTGITARGAKLNRSKICRKAPGVLQIFVDFVGTFGNLKLMKIDENMLNLVTLYILKIDENST